MNQTISIECQAVIPEPVMVTVDGVTFPLKGPLATFYRIAEYADMAEAFLKEMKPYYWKEYRAAVRLKEVEEERRQMILEQAAENKRAVQADKSRIRRMRNKSGITTPDNAAQNPVKGK